MNFSEFDFVNIENTYRPRPFWTLNDRLSGEETRRQIKIMKEAGVGGFFLHARGGLEDEYLGKTWFDNIETAADEGEKQGLIACAYDENGWPSGFADGKVPSLGRKYTHKQLLCEEGEKETDTTVANVDGFHFYFKENIHYVDLLDAEVTDKFIEYSYEPYRERCGNKILAFFTDEPQLMREGGLPYTLNLFSEFEAEYGFSLIPHLPALFFERENSEEIKICYWRLIAKLYKNNYAKRIYDWCEKYGYLFTGHYLLEEDFPSQIKASGSIMAQYRYMHIPGCDLLTRRKVPGGHVLSALQVSSVAHQFDFKQVISETYAASGQSMNFDDYRALYEWQAVRGVTLLCPHTQHYSMRGLRKRDYPPQIYFNQPWWDKYHIFTETAGRIGKILSEGKTDFGVLLLHPLVSCWASFDNGKNEGVYALQNAFVSDIKALEGKHIPFDIGDELIMEEEAFVKDGKIHIGSASYHTLIIPEGKFHLEKVNKLIEEFKKQGGKIVSANDLEANDITEEGALTYTLRRFSDFTAHYFVNSTESEICATFKRGNLILSLADGTLAGFDGKYTFAPFESIILIEKDNAVGEKPITYGKNLALPGENWDVVSHSPNALTLDMCDCFFDGEKIAENEYVLNILGKALALKTNPETELIFRFNASFKPENISLGIEGLEIMDEIKVNGQLINKKSSGSFFDRSVSLLDIRDAVKVGENEISVKFRLSQSDEVYAQIGRAKEFEGELNKIKFDTETEPLYLVGDFAVISEGDYEELPNRAVRTEGPFTLCPLPEKVSLTSLEKQGFPFFAGKLTLKNKVSVKDVNSSLMLKKEGINAVSVKVNGKAAADFIYDYAKEDLSSYLKEGENEIELTLANTLRNLLGPHHLIAGEPNLIEPQSFYEDDHPFKPGKTERHKGYCFVKTGVKSDP